MAPSTHLDPAGLLEALTATATVLGDHRAALDHLDPLDGLSESVTIGGHGEPAEESAPELVAVPAGVPAGVAAGTDLAATLDSIVAAAQGATSFAALADAVEQGAVAGAVGAAGAGVATVVGGLAEAVRNADRLDAGRVAIGLELAAERLAPGDDGRHAGCLPAVVAAAADAALGAVDEGADLADVLIAAAEEGLVELESGPRSNPDLVERGVVDAAAAGFLLLLDVFCAVVTGEPLPSPPAPPVESGPARAASRHYVVRCQVEPHEGCGLESANWLESTWHDLGELVEFDPTGARWRAELHTTLPGAAVEAVFDVGRPRELHVGLVEPGT